MIWIRSICSNFTASSLNTVQLLAQQFTFLGHTSLSYFRDRTKGFKEPFLRECEISLPQLRLCAQCRMQVLSPHQLH